MGVPLLYIKILFQWILLKKIIPLKNFVDFHLICDIIRGYMGSRSGSLALGCRLEQIYNSKKKKNTVT